MNCQTKESEKKLTRIPLPMEMTVIMCTLRMIMYITIFKCMYTFNKQKEHVPGNATLFF